MKRRSGFTLIEVLAALFIMSVIAAAAFAGLDALARATQATEAERDRMGALSLFFARMESGLSNAVFGARRDGSVTSPSLSGGGGRLEFVTLSGAGNRHAPARVGYSFAGGVVDYLAWATLDGPGGETPEAFTALEGIAEFEVSFLDETFQWAPGWSHERPPLAVKVTVTETNGNTVWRIFDLPKGV